MPLRTALTRLAIVTAAGALTLTAAVTPVLADDWDGQDDAVSSQDDGSYDWQNQGGDGQSGTAQQQGQAQGNGQTQGQGQGQTQGQGQNQGQGQGQTQSQGQTQGQGRPQGQNQNQGQGQNQTQGQNQGQGQNQANGVGQGNQNAPWQSGGTSTWQNGNGNGNGTSTWQNGGGGGGGGGDNWQNGGGNQGGHNDARRYRGRVTAGELLLRSAPTRASQVIRVVRRGQIVSIFCRTPGQKVQGNSVWYLLTDGTWAWGSARYIQTIGTTPRWC
ncbi:SH3 domain-containing protein [Streptomyces asoensis]|uniref:SH3 domain-containing protein n=1 Tax=Streptomyces asoensis TaxID=249586 RepID=UPI003406B903